MNVLKDGIAKQMTAKSYETIDLRVKYRDTMIEFSEIEKQIPILRRTLIYDFQRVLGFPAPAKESAIKKNLLKIRGDISK
jgi:hypothetical protein